MKRKTVGGAASLVMLAATLSACGGNPAAPQGNYGSVLAIVKSTGGQPISGAQVAADSVLTCTTGSDGKCTIQTVPVDSPSTRTPVTVTNAPGYQISGQTQNVSIASGKTTEVDFALSPQ